MVGISQGREMVTDKLTNYEQMLILIEQLFGTEKPISGCHVGLFQGDMEVALLDRFPLLIIEGVDPLGAYRKLTKLPNGQELPIPVAIDLGNLRARTSLWDRFKFHMGTSDDILPFLHGIGKLFDYVYIDGDHRYEQVKRDIQNCLKIVSPDGILFGDDYRHESDYEQITDQVLGPQVKRAVDESIHKNLHIEDAGTWWAYKRDISW